MFKDTLKGISSEADKTFKQLSQLDEIDFNKLRENKFQDFIKENELADKSLVRFLEDVDIKIVYRKRATILIDYSFCVYKWYTNNF